MNILPLYKQLGNSSKTLKNADLDPENKTLFPFFPTGKNILLFLVCLLPLQNQVFSQNDWKLTKQENGISVYLQNARNSKFKELRSVVKIRTSISSMVALLNDWDSYPLWVYRCGKSSTLKEISDTEVIHYQTVIAPWPVDNRDFVVNVKLSQDEKTKTVYQRTTCIPTYIPPVAQHVRITEFKASWTLTPLSDGYLNIEYQLLVDPGGSVPVWLVNLAVVDGPYETMLNIKEWVMKEKYQKATFTYIEEP